RSRVFARTALIAMGGGPMVLALPVVALPANWWPGWFGGLAAAAMVAGGVIASVTSHPALQGAGAFGAPAQACALVALVCALMPVWPERQSARGTGGSGATVAAGSAGIAPAAGANGRWT